MSILEKPPERPDPEKGIPDGISIVGLVLLLIIVLSTVGASLGASSEDSKGQAAKINSESSPTSDLHENDQALAVIDTADPPATATATATATSIPTETNTPTATTIPTETPTNTLEPTSTPTEQPTMTHTPGPTSTPTQTPKPPPLPTPHDEISRTLRVPILMYHYISLPPENADKYRLDLSVSPKDFRDQMAYLVENGYTSISLYDLSRAITGKQVLPDKPVIISLDDGYRDNYENAFPILQEYDLQATFFLATDFLDRGDPDYMTWEMVKEMSDAGMSIEPHSKTHPDLTGQDRDFVIYQMLGSSETIEARTGIKPRYFAYPSGRYDEEVMQITEELEFWGAVTTLGGVWHGYNDRYEWTRLRVRNVTQLLDFIDMLE
ncbi:MAG: polysaccharide deacetylase family protein [Candidatus Promineifilaceae bacterium]